MCLRSCPTNASSCSGACIWFHAWPWKSELRRFNELMKVDQNHSSSLHTLHTKGCLSLQESSFHPMSFELELAIPTVRQFSPPLLFGSPVHQAVKLISVPSIHNQVPSDFLSLPPSQTVPESILEVCMFMINCCSPELRTEARCPLKDVHISSASWKVFASLKCLYRQEFRRFHPVTFIVKARSLRSCS